MTSAVPKDIRIWIVPLTEPTKARRRRQARRELEQILSEELGAALQDLGIAPDAGGKPQLPDRLVNFNLSHSAEIAMIAVSRERAVGIDVERVREFKNGAGLQRRICSERELEHLGAISAAGAGSAGGAAEAAANSVAAELLRLWVRKEAVVKAIGDGITRELSTVDVLGEEVVESTAIGGWRCLDLPSPAPGYLAAVAFASAEHE